MEILEFIKDYLSNKGLEVNVENLSNGEKILSVYLEDALSSLFIRKINQKNNQLSLYAIVKEVDERCECDVYEIVNEWNKRYAFIKFFYQESEQGNIIFSSYNIPSLNKEGILYFLDIMVDCFSNALLDVILSSEMVELLGMKIL